MRRPTSAWATFYIAIFLSVCVLVLAGSQGKAQSSPTKPLTSAPPYHALEILTPHEGVDFTAFESHLEEAVKRNWYAKMPDDARKGDKGRVAVRFKVQRDGTLLDKVPTIEAGSGKMALDNSAVVAIQSSTPFEHLPESFRGPYIELRLNFFYNMPMPGQRP
jgi:TonB family protein